MHRLRLFSYSVLAIFLLATVFAAGYVTHWLLSQGGQRPIASALASPEVTTSEEDEFAIFWEAWHILQRDFFGDKPDIQQRTYGAVKGLVQEYGDPYTYFIEPQPRQREKENLSGEFGGIGAWVSRAEDGTIRLDPMPARAAELAGVQRDDILEAVDGEPVLPEMTVDDVVALIRGPVGEPVSLAILRLETGSTLTLDVMRERIETPSVEWRVLEESPQTGYVAIKLFGERTAKELDRAITDLQEQDTQRLVLDLRHNPGGLLQAAVDVASRFLSDGVVLYEIKSDGTEKTYQVSAGPKAPNWPIALLIDGATASASEIVAGALRDRSRATLVGEKTFGKGSVQLVHDLSDGSSIHVTVAHWLTPNGHELNSIGLTPDLEIPGEEGRDAPLEAAVRFLTSDGLR